MEVSSVFVIEEKLTKTAACVKQDKLGFLVLWLRLPDFRQMPILHRTKRLSPDFICAYTLAGKSKNNRKTTG
jgi:hypothetical protein